MTEGIEGKTNPQYLVISSVADTATIFYREGTPPLVDLKAVPNPGAAHP
jgi:hypothetical protein